MPISFAPTIIAQEATPQGVADWARTQFEILGQLLAEASTLEIIVGDAPADAAAPGRKGQVIMASDGYVYFCFTANTWVRLQPVTWP